ncbi:MAG: hypothetical protein MHM6MM_005045 [Cercozoa sp. M6MM]
MDEADLEKATESMSKLRGFAQSLQTRPLHLNELVNFISALRDLHRTQYGVVDEKAHLVELRCALLYTAWYANARFNYAFTQFKSLLTSHSEELRQFAPTLWKSVSAVESLVIEPLQTKIMLKEIETLGKNSANAEVRRACDFSDDLTSRRKKRSLLRSNGEPPAKRSCIRVDTESEGEAVSDIDTPETVEQQQDDEKQVEEALESVDKLAVVFPESDSEFKHRRERQSIFAAQEKLGISATGGLDFTDELDTDVILERVDREVALEEKKKQEKKKQEKKKQEKKKQEKKKKTKKLNDEEAEQLTEQQKLLKYENWLQKAKKRQKKLAKIGRVHRTSFDPKSHKAFLDAMHAMFVSGDASEKRIMWSRLTRVLYDRGELNLAERVCLPKRKNGRSILRTACTSSRLEALRSSYPAKFRAFLDAVAGKAKSKPATDSHLRGNKDVQCDDDGADSVPPMDDVNDKDKDNASGKSDGSGQGADDFSDSDDDFSGLLNC